MIGFDFSIEYKPGRQNTVAGALSHVQRGEANKEFSGEETLNEDEFVCSLLIAIQPVSTFLEELRKEQQQNIELVVLIRKYHAK